MRLAMELMRLLAKTPPFDNGSQLFKRSEQRVATSDRRQLYHPYQDSGAYQTLKPSILQHIVPHHAGLIFDTYVWRCDTTDTFIRMLFFSFLISWGAIARAAGLEVTRHTAVIALHAS